MNRVQRAALIVVLACCSAVHGQENRPRRQFPGGEWVPLTQPCPTCRPLADPADTRTNVNDIGLVPPRPPLASRQVHGTGNFFSQNFQPQQFQQRPFQDFSNFQFNQQQFPPAQHFFPQQQQAAFLPQTYLNNPQLLLNENPQLLPLVSNPQLLLGQQKAQVPSVNSVPSGDKKEDNQLRFKPDQDKSSTKLPQNIRLEQEANPPLTRLELPLSNPPAQFLQNQQFQQIQQQQQQQQQFPQFQQLQQQQQAFPQFQQPPQKFQQFQQFQTPRPEQQSLLQVNPNDPFLTPPPFRNSSDIQIPGLEKEEIQLLYVPVETLRQRGHLQGHQVDDFNLNQRPLQQIIQAPNGHFITQNPTPSPRPQFPSITPPAVLTQGLPLRDAPQQFASEPPATNPTTEQIVTIQPRPVSTVRQQTKADSLRFTARPSTRPSDPTPTQTRGTTFLSNEHLTKVTESLGTESTPPSPQPTLPTPPEIEPAQQHHQQQQQQQQHQHQQQRFQSRPQPTFQQLHNIPEFESQLPQIPHLPPKHRFTPVPRPALEFTTEITHPTTTLQPHQPPLSVYMGSDSGNVKIVDVLRALKGAPSIAVIDNFSPDNPRVFVGPANLNTPPGFGKFELPYLSNLEQESVQGRINVPFFVAPLNFIPPPGYSKIPFPAPHVGSVVVSTETGVQPSLPDQGITSEATIREELNSVEPDIPTTALPETTTTLRTRGRRPNNYYRPSGRKPVNSRQRATVRPFEEETSPSIAENQVSPQDFLREPQEERKRPTLASRRHRYRTSTEPIPELAAPVNDEQLAIQAPAAEVPAPQQAPADIPRPPVHRLVEPVLPPADFTQPQATFEFQHVPIPPRNQFRRPTFPESDFNPPPPPPPPSFEFRQSHPVSSDFRPPHQASADFQPPHQVSSDLRPSNQATPHFHQQQIENSGEPTFTSFQQPQSEQQQQRFQQFLPTSQEIQGLFEVPIQSPQPQPAEPLVENNGDSGFHQQNNENQEVTTIRPISSTQFFENVQSQSPSEESESFQTEPTKRIQTTTTTAPTTAQEKEPDSENFEKVAETPRKPSYPNVPGVKSYPNPGSVKQRSHLRSRPRFTTPSTTTAVEDSEGSQADISSPTAEESTSSPPTRTTSKYQSHFNRSRKPLRPNTVRPETTTASPSRSSYTVRPLRRSTLRTSVATKRIRKPTTPSPLDTEEDDIQEPSFTKETRPSFVPSGDSNEVFDEQVPPSYHPKPKVRKPYYQHKQKNVEVIEDGPTSPSPSTKTYQERKDEESTVDETIEHSNVELSPSGVDVDAKESHASTTAPSGPTGPSAAEEHEKKGANEEKKKASDPELTKKPRRRLRVRVQKRPHDNFEAAESQNHGSLSNALIKSTPAPDLYSFPQNVGFDFEASGKFIGTQHKGHVRNITADILESTSTFSSPGTDAEVHLVTIASEPTTIQPEITTSEETAGTEARSQQHETTTIKQETTYVATTDPVETTTSSEEIASTVPELETSSQAPSTNLPSSTEEPKEDQKQAKVLRTSTTTQVSHETEICYKGKCIKTNSDNPDQALKRLVESANLDEISKEKS